MQRWWLLGLVGFYPLLAQANWQTHLSLPSSEPTPARSQAANEQEITSPLDSVDTLTFGRDVVIDTTLYEALGAEGVPTRFATKLETLLSEFIESPLEFSGSERIQLVWEEDRGQDGTLIGPPRLSYAALPDQAEPLEVIWPVAQKGDVALFKNDSLLGTLRLPVLSARLTSRFGNRRHPVYGGMRPHNGIDLAAPTGTPVIATAPGRVSFIGRQGGYGQVIEVEHDTGAMSRYTHLSRFSPKLMVGDLVNAGESLGEVGASGVATGPNLHYEVRINNQPVDPLGQGERIMLGEQPTQSEYQASLYEARDRLEHAIGTASIYDLISFKEP
ncbi:M23 family metallopeptidase [Halomonas sp. Mc5H-6]|uniref:M23 family metallopeptidase n=1 Tax=Halomonas sp. Mc5H-6 TaxID=2954500 RepID=UPI002097B369|nr:M23 family metallopeptidase [Halomonas sp. Mc5H-6]MCO7248149.1 M23 family metallopeptidase [Halomonas sp. Mc5H-6]